MRKKHFRKRLLVHLQKPSLMKWRRDCKELDKDYKAVGCGAVQRVLKRGMWEENYVVMLMSKRNRRACSRTSCAGKIKEPGRRESCLGQVLWYGWFGRVRGEQASVLETFWSKRYRGKEIFSMLQGSNSRVRGQKKQWAGQRIEWGQQVSFWWEEVMPILGLIILSLFFLFHVWTCVTLL